MNLSDSLISDIRTFTDKGFSSIEEHQLKRCVLDWLGVSLAGSFVIGKRIEPVLQLSGAGNCSVFVSNRKIDLLSAAFLNGFVAHEMELDDGHRFGMLHLGAPIISAMVAVAQQEKLDYSHFMKGVIAGYQTTVKLARLIQPYHKQCGFHATGTCGTIGVTMAVAIALNLSDEQIRNALGAAVTQAAGLLAAIDSPSELKPYNVAGAVVSGIRSAYLAKAGFRGPIDPLNGKRGFMKVYRPEADITIPHFDGDSEILNIYFKPYLSCRHCHAPAEAALKLRSKYSFELKNIKDIKVETYFLAINGHDSKDVSTVEAAKMSIPYSVAVVLLRGSCGIESFTSEMVSNPVLVELTQKVNVVENTDLTLACPEKRGAIVSVTTKDGSSYSYYVDNPLGEPEHPMSDEMLESKYRELISFSGFEKERSEELMSAIWNLDKKFNQFLGLL